MTEVLDCYGVHILVIDQEFTAWQDIVVDECRHEIFILFEFFGDALEL
jgi:hypothetical protein